MPFDNPVSQPAKRPGLWRPALTLAALAALLTFLAVRWHLPFAGTAALVTVFGGGLWLGLRLLHRLSRR